MELLFEDKKLLFYSGLSKDKDVQLAGAEENIRCLTENIILYWENANVAHYDLHRERMARVLDKLHQLTSTVSQIISSQTDDQVQHEKVKGVVEKIETLLARPAPHLPLDFEDVQEIAYVVGLHSTRSDDASESSPPQYPLENRVKKYEEAYNILATTQTLKDGFLDTETLDLLSIANDPQKHMDERANNLERMLHRCCQYINRKARLINLAKAGEKLKLYDRDKGWEHFKRGFLHGDWSWATAMWGGDRLEKNEIDEIAGYFRLQAEIDGNCFKMIRLISAYLTESISPQEETEQLYQKLMADYERDGKLDATYTPSNQQSHNQTESQTVSQS